LVAYQGARGGPDSGRDRHPIRQMCRSYFVELGGAIAAINMICRLLEEGHTGTGDRRSADVAIGEKRTGADQMGHRCLLKPPCA